MMPGDLITLHKHTFRYYVLEAGIQRRSDGYVTGKFSPGDIGLVLAIGKKDMGNEVTGHCALIVTNTGAMGWLVCESVSRYGSKVYAVKVNP